MTNHFVAQGECLSSIAKTYGFFEPMVIFDFEANSTLKADRKNPNILYPKDCVAIPDLASKTNAAPTNSENLFQLKRPKTDLQLKIADECGGPCTDLRYNLCIDNKSVGEGQTSAEGMIVEAIPADLQFASLTIWFDEDSVEGRTWDLLLGHLDPVKHLTGVQARLNNLGYPCGLVDGINGPLTKAAVRKYQADHDLGVDAIPGPLTQGSLEDKHGC